MDLLISEILDKVSKAKTKNEKVNILREFNSNSLRMVIKASFDPSIVWDLPEGDVPFFGENDMKTTTMSERIEDAIKQMNGSSLGAIDQRYSTIRKEYTKFYNFIKGGNDTLNGIRRENIFVNLLEGLHPLEAEILCLCKDKKLESKYKINKEIVTEAYPDIVWGNRG